MKVPCCMVFCARPVRSLVFDTSYALALSGLHDKVCMNKLLYWNEH
jgi:hypothetical protein